jgi:hypothetical protein
MLNFTIKKEKIIVKILFNLYYENTMIFYGNNRYKENNISINTASLGKIKLKVNLNELIYDINIFKILKKEPKYGLAKSPILYFSNNNVIEIQLLNYYKFYNENLKNKEIIINPSSFIINPIKIKQLKELLKIRNF